MPARRSFIFIVALLLSVAAGRPSSAIVLQDRQIYLGAKKDYEQLAKGKITPQTRGQAEKIAERFERLPQEYPKSRYCDSAYYYAGIIHQELYQSSKEQRSLDRAIRNFRLLVAKYPGSGYAAEGRYRLALALETGKGANKEVQQQYAIVAAKYSNTEWGRKSRARLEALKTDIPKAVKQETTGVAAGKRRPEETATPVVLTEKKDATAQPRAIKPAAPAAMRKIVIDPGHGGRDPGAIGMDGLAEKDIALAVARKLAARLKNEKGIEALLTRDDDRFVPLEERTAMANREAADLFISLHVNASPNGDARGIETYYLDNTTDEAALRMAARENGIAREKISDLQFILSDMVQNLKLEDSITLAHRLQGSIVTSMGRRYGEVRDLGVKKAQFYVLVGARMPSVLVEMFFITNRTEARALSLEEYQNALADALFEGIKKYQENSQVVKKL